MKTKNLLMQIINDSKVHTTLLSIYENRNEVDKFYVGYVVDIFNDSILLYTFDEYGENDGYLLIRLVDIYKIEKRSNYLNNLNFLANQNSKKEKKSFKIEGKEGIADIISNCQENHILLSVKLIYDDYIYGFITEEDNDRFLIETYSTNGMYEGYTLIEYKDIQNIHFEGRDEKKIVKLIKK